MPGSSPALRPDRLACREVLDPEALEGVYRLRYRILVEELGRVSPHADADRRRLEEPLDAGARQLAAYEPNAPAPLGALRLNRGDDPGLASVEALYGLPPGGLGPRSMLAMRLVTRPEARGGGHRVLLGLARAAHRIALREGVDRLWLDCSPELADRFAWLGFDPVHRFEHGGEVVVMSADPRDRVRLGRSGSPLLEVLAEWEASGADRPEQSTDSAA